MKYILYARKSTDEPDRQILSIEAQLVELQEYAAKEKLEIVASLCEAKTAKEPGKTIGLNHVLTERRKEKFLIIKFIRFKIRNSRDADFLLGLTYSPRYAIFAVA